ncbi:MAG: hypothetical protein A2231_00940 [Candidatus Firestonebacteria bacterium RIFOXYA2_FULL_40_8]|nr:MAG: hypothetical protein A2231_00940 [Candidatus Firestonebacteria bacterium RIFOXYA2_FULL_40_8]
MRKYLILILLLSIIFAGCATVLKTDIPSGVKELRSYGKIIDNACAAQHKNDIAEFSATYSIGEALKCTIGYAFYTTSGIREFDLESNDRISRHLREKNADLNIDIKYYVIDNKIHLIEIVLPKKITKD